MAIETQKELEQMTTFWCFTCSKEIQGEMREVPVNVRKVTGIQRGLYLPKEHEGHAIEH